MTFEHDAWNDMRSAGSRLSPSERHLMDEVHRAALDYADARGRWLLSPPAARASQEDARSRAHDRFIDACNALSRACGRAGASQEWRATWGDARSGEARRRIGDFACYIAYRLALEAR